MNSKVTRPVSDTIIKVTRDGTLRCAGLQRVGFYWERYWSVKCQMSGKSEGRMGSARPVLLFMNGRLWSLQRHLSEGSSFNLSEERARDIQTVYTGPRCVFTQNTGNRDIYSRPMGVSVSGFGPFPLGMTMLNWYELICVSAVFPWVLWGGGCRQDAWWIHGVNIMPSAPCSFKGIRPIRCSCLWWLYRPRSLRSLWCWRRNYKLSFFQTE